MNKTELERFCRNLDWNLLYTYLVVCEERGITKAAKRLLVTQPAITNALKRLETQFECQLLDRNEREFTLTQAGQVLFEECLELHSSVTRMTEALKGVRDEVIGHVSVATASHAISPLIDQALKKFHSENPKATLSMSVVTSGDVVTLVKRKSASCGFAIINTMQSGLNYDLMYREKFSLYCGTDNPLFGRDDISLDELRAQPYVTFPTDEIGGEMSKFTRARHKIGYDKTPVGRSYHVEELRRMIEIGIGIGPIPRHVGQKYVDQGRLWEIKSFKNSPVFELFLVTNPRTRINQAEKAFIQILTELIEQTPLNNRTYYTADADDLF